MTGQMFVYIGIGLVALGVIGEILAMVIFKSSKKKMIQKIYDSYDNQ